MEPRVADARNEDRIETEQHTAKSHAKLGRKPTKLERRRVTSFHAVETSFTLPFLAGEIS